MNIETNIKPTENSLSENVLKPFENLNIQTESERTSTEADVTTVAAAARPKTVLEEKGYQIIEDIGSGSYATVKKALSISENTIVAVKVLTRRNMPENMNKFLSREIQVVKRLHHDNILKYFKCIQTTHRIYIVMEYVSNGSLLDLIREKTQLTEDIAQQIYKQLLNAIEYCHKCGVVHRDIKCENILFDGSFILKLIDFGFAKAVSTHAETLSDTYCGSYAYACPEILKGIPYNPMYADIWASGVVLFTMVFGRLPFDDRSYSKLLKQVGRKLNFATTDERMPVSEACKNILEKIIAPYVARSQISQINEHIWMQTEDSNTWESTNNVCDNDNTAPETESKSKNQIDDNNNIENNNDAMIDKIIVNGQSDDKLCI